MIYLIHVNFADVKIMFIFGLELQKYIVKRL